jgi:hypothetical protein
MYVLDPICISTEGQVAPTGLQPFSLSTKGIVCVREDARGGDPEGAWEKGRRQFERRLADVPRETSDDLRADRAQVTELLADLELERIEAEQLLEVQFDQVDTRELEARERIIFLGAFRAQRRLEELERQIQYARELRRKLDDEIILMLAVVAMFFTKDQV